ncbi:DNA-binding helix-turn-helix protein [Coriobacteriaceae bacterium BV3Ac1]|nr:DNA-binding helix-turn-helix protein [Coriobacteriaceae bacterium BV3Ac1]
MSHPYDESMVDNAMNTVGKAFDFAYKRLPGGVERFYDLFCSSEIARSFEGPNAHPRIEVSGIEFVMSVCAESASEVLDTALFSERHTPRGQQDRGKWCGRTLAYHQWETGSSFRAISLYLSGSDLIDVYLANRIATPRAGALAIERDYVQEQDLNPTRLHDFRLTAGFTQTELARVSGVGLRSIQQYEQRKKDINRAQARSVARLAEALSCRMEDLLEDM